MKIAITADNHLTSRAQHPERYETLENIFDDLLDRGPSTLIIAGDLFDETRQDYSDFVRLCNKEVYQALRIIVVPGNHDSGIDNRKIVSKNVEIITEPTIREMDGHPFLFLPYKHRTTMGEQIVGLASDLDVDKWILVSHGDWAEGLRVPNPAEPGIYMPLTRRDIDTYKPVKVFLGHIHMSMDTARVHYVGSPCGLDITETGRRRYLIFDTDTDQVEERPVIPPVIYFNELFIVVPAEDEATYLRGLIKKRKDKWNIQPEEIEKAQIRIRVDGYSADPAGLLPVLHEEFAGFTFYKGGEPDVTKVKHSDDLDRHHIASQVQEAMLDLEWHRINDDPDDNDVLLAALRIIYNR